MSVIEASPVILEVEVTVDDFKDLMVIDIFVVDDVVDVAGVFGRSASFNYCIFVRSVLAVNDVAAFEQNLGLTELFNMDV